MNKIKKFFVLFALMAFAGMLGSAAEASWHISDAFDGSAQWQLGSMRDGKFTAYTKSGDYSAPLAAYGNKNAGFFVKNNGDNVVKVGSGYFLRGNTAVVPSANGNIKSVAVFTAPESGMYFVRAIYVGQNESGVSADCVAVKNKDTIFTDSVNEFRPINSVKDYDAYAVTSTKVLKMDKGDALSFIFNNTKGCETSVV
ncbi:MAG: hypothetical protein IJT09_05075, partial [Abditibacteriota bacterium]|nr:hypothetical protein [Abditibacteriota bacterium]